MDKDSKPAGLTGLPGGGVLALLTLAAGALFLRPAPLETTRPAANEPRIEQRLAPQDVDARLWQDPLGAVERARKERSGRLTARQIDADDQEHRLASLSKGLGSHADQHNTVVLGVMLNGAPYAEQIENRRRARYAVLAALNAGRFAPKDTEHLGYVLPQLEGKPAEGLPTAIPYEWFEPAPGDGALAVSPQRDPRRVLVLWLDGRAFRQNPLARLKSLVNALHPPGAAAAGRSTPAWRVLGPTDSDGLKVMVEEARRFSAAPYFGDVDLRFYSPTATVPDKILLAEPIGAASAARAAPPARLASYFEQRGVQLVRTTNDDHQLASTLIDELERRGLKPTNARDAHEPDYASLCWDPKRDNPLRSTIAVIAEWDTLYGRNLRREFMAPNRDTEGKGFCVQGFSYVRGLDGLLPESAAGTASGNGKGDASSKATGSRQDAAIERAEGQSQFDYLRRVAAQMRQRDRQLRAHGGNDAGIRAIGVLGNDVHDKLLILQALRAEFPDALFFTTDLDARLLDPREQASARNLIVASNFGLRLNDGIQRETPPFRNGNQTSTYFATRLALDPVNDKAPQGKLDRWLGRPRIFEIGRTGAFDFGTPGSTDAKLPGVAPAAAPDGKASEVAPGRELDAGRRSHKRTLSSLWPFDAAAAEPPPAAGPAPAGAPSCWGRDWLRDCPDIHPPSSPMYPTAPFGTRFAIFLLVLASSWACVLVLSPGVRRAWLYYVKKPRRALPGARRWGWLIGLQLAVLLGLSATLANAWEPFAEWLTHDDKPLSFSEGISLWPTEAIRVFTLLLCIYLIGRGWHGLAHGIDKITVEFNMTKSRRRLVREQCATDRRLRWWQSLGNMFALPFGDVVLARPIGIPGLSRGAANFWKRYIVQNRLKSRGARTALCVLLMVLLTWLLITACDDATLVPQRGVHSRVVHGVLAWATTLATYALIFFVVDATVFCVGFVHQLNDKKHSWPHSTLERFTRKLDIPPHLLDSWIDLEFISKRTSCVSQLIYYPFIVLSLMLLSRSSTFDDWTLSIGAKACTGLCVLIVLGCAFALRRMAEKSRRLALEEIDETLTRAQGRTQKPAVSVNQLQLLRTRVVDLHEGAFAPYSQQPMLKAMLLPFAALGGSTLLDYMALLSL